MLFFATFVDHRIWWHSTELHDKLDLFLLVVSWEKWLTCVELSQDASKRPNINFLSVLDSHNDLWRTVETRLNIGVDLLITEAARTKVNNLEVSAHGVSTENILWLEITMNDLMLLQEYQSFDYLHCIVPNLVC